MIQPLFFLLGRPCLPKPIHFAYSLFFPAAFALAAAAILARPSAVVLSPVFLLRFGGRVAGQIGKFRI
jgi:hypothetical protein